jgi:hypothetical protein
MLKNSSQHSDVKRRQALKNGKVQELLKDQQRLHSNQHQREVRHLMFILFNSVSIANFPKEDVSHLFGHAYHQYLHDNI